MKFSLYTLFGIFTASAQIQHGTIALILFDDDKIIMAADSRGNSGGANPNNRDDECKIAVFEDKVIYVSAGFVAFKSNVPQGPSWTNMDEARKAYSTVLERFGSIQGHTSDTAEEFADRLGQNFSLIAADRDLRALALREEVLTEAFFAGVSATGSLEMARAKIVADPHHPGRLRRDVEMVIRCITDRICVSGQKELGMEFAQRDTERAKAEAKTWTTIGDATSPQDYDIVRTIQLAQTIARYDTEGTIGGPIDAVQLNRDGTIRWYRRKQNCK
jgi:hypothetical protein